MADSITILQTLSQNIAQAVERAALSVVNIDDGTRLTASGAIWTEDGIIIATSHGVEQDENLVVLTHDGAQYPATVLGRDPESDIAVLKIEATGLHSFSAAASADAAVGSIALAIGRPGHTGLQATFGIIGSSSPVQIPNGEAKIYHPDATLYPGFSGGALVDPEGNFLGLLNLSFGRGRGVALGTRIVQEVLDSILAHGTVQRGYLGIATQPAILAKSLRDTLGRSEEKGLLVVSVETESPAERDGLLVGDTILTLNGQATADPYELRRVLRSMRAGDVAELEVVRGAQLTNMSVTLGVRVKENDEEEDRREHRHRHRGNRWRRH